MPVCIGCIGCMICSTPYVFFLQNVRRIIILSQKFLKSLRAGYGITSESDSAEYSESSVQHEGPQIAQGEAAEFECDFVGFESGVFFVRASKRDITEGT